MATPTISFTVDLSRLNSEAIGTITNASNQGVLHPDRHQGDQDRAIADIAQRRTLKMAYLPGINTSMNRELKHGDTFTETGKAALYLRDMYGIGYATDASRAVLRVDSIVG